MRNIVMPGARIIVTVVMMLTAPSVPDVPVRMIDDDPQVGAEARRAGRARQRRVGEPAEAGRAAVGDEPEQHRCTPPNRYSQYDSALRRGNARSGAPICSGTR